MLLVIQTVHLSDDLLAVSMVNWSEQKTVILLGDLLVFLMVPVLVYWSEPAMVILWDDFLVFLMVPVFVYWSKEWNSVLVFQF